eukprot:10234656-Alexandrium_andersonii.AAC.1
MDSGKVADPSGAIRILLPALPSPERIVRACACLWFFTGPGVSFTSSEPGPARNTPQHGLIESSAPGSERAAKAMMSRRQNIETLDA